MVAPNDSTVEVPTSFAGGRYVVRRCIGSGSQGETFEAMDTRRNVPVAVKRFHVRGAKSWKDVELAEREARVLAALDHQGIPHFVEHFEENGALLLVTELIEGEPLARAGHADGSRRMSEQDVRRFLHDAAGILGYLHGRAPPVIHRDIKPGNVIRRPDGSFALVDFGAVRDGLRPGGGSTVVGTFGYMAPEQFQGRALPASDVYATGATAMFMLTGQQPEDLPHKGLGIDVDAALAGAGVRPEMIAALRSMLEPDPDRRASSLAPLLASLDRPAVRSAVSASRPPGAKIATPAAPAFPVGWGAMSRKERRRLGHELRRQGREAWRDGRDRERMEADFASFQRELPNIPLPVRLFLVALFTVLMVGLSVGLRVLLPMLLRILSVVFGPALRTAATRVQESGQRAIDMVRQYQQAVNASAQQGIAANQAAKQSQSPHAAAPPTAEEAVPEAHVRVDVPAGDVAQDRVEVERDRSAVDATGEAKGRARAR